MKLKKSLKIARPKFLLAASLCLPSCSNNISKEKMKDMEIIDIIVDNFMQIAKVPRISHHEEKISAFLMDWAKKEGLEVKRDQVNNVMIIVPATKGLENKPLGILQVHMDMVVAVADGKKFNPLTDAITVIRNDGENTLTADGTSLGGDDGIGIAMVMAVATNKMEHGPLRIIITVDEEDGMDGAFNLSKTWLDGAAFLINIDNEWSSEVLVSTAAGYSVHTEKKVSKVKPKGNMALSVSISNLKGGHSGVEIDKGRLNGLIGLAKFLKKLNPDNINFELASFMGGTASNAIPAKAIATIIINKDDQDKLKQEFRNYCDMLKASYKGIEDEMRCDIQEIKKLPQVISKEERDNALKFITEVIDGVYTMSSDMEGLVESSSNLGLFMIDENMISFTTMLRSSSPEKETEILNASIKLAKECGYDATSVKSSDAWPYDPNSKLLKLTKEIYLEQNKEEIKVSAVHAGIECGTFKKMKPELDMVSIGPDLMNGHTIKETLYLNSIPKVWHLLEGILKNYK